VSICMENGDGKNGSSNDKECVKVAVNVRPLITSELLNGCTDCITVVPGEPQVRNRACKIVVSGVKFVVLGYLLLIGSYTGANWFSCVHV